MILEPIFNKYPFIRDMTEADIAAVQAVERAAHDFPWSDGILRDCMLVGYSCFVLEIENGICGFAVMSVSGIEAHILNVCVEPSQQRKGHGRYLMQHLLSIAKQLGAKTAFLEVRASNHAALALYENLGFNQVSITKDYYPAPNDQREDAIILALQLVTGSNWR
jgi:[ribosomal protein S18]-alanine N-acetyltransferase